MPIWGMDAVSIDQLDPSARLVLVTGACALLAVAVDRVWLRARNVVTIVHEGGHAVAAVLTGRRLTGIRLHSNTSGLTLSVGKPRGPGMVVTTAAGYVSPSLVGLVGVVLLAFDQVTVMLWAGTAVLAAMLVMVRNLFGVLALVVTGGVVVAVSVLASPGVQAAFGHTMVWFLLLGAVRPVGELQRQRRRHPEWDSDADQLARITRLPAAAWVALFGVVTLGALAAGSWLLLA
ncbi:MAG TPA: M50 family metallopeptidase [Acidimicrobiales bacterium]